MSIGVGAHLKKADGSDVTDLVIPQQINGTNVTKIPYSLFSYARTLVSVVLPDGLKAIDHYAFGHCDVLKKVVIPSTVEMIAEAAFNDCFQLSSVSIDVPEVALNVRRKGVRWLRKIENCELCWNSGTMA